MSGASTQLSAEVLSELEETFSSISSTKDSKGYIAGDCLSRMMASVGLSFPKATHTYYLEEGKTEKIYFENFIKHVISCVDKQKGWMDAEIEDTFQYFRDGDDSDRLDSQELHSWLTHLGEHVDNDDVEGQLYAAMNDGDMEGFNGGDPGMRLSGFVKMCRSNVP